MRNLSASDSLSIELKEETFINERIGFKSEVSRAKRINRLEQAFEYIYDEIDYKDTKINLQHQRLSKSLNKLEEQVNKESKRLEAFSKEAVTGDVRLQLRGLVFIGSGTFLICQHCVH